MRAITESQRLPSLRGLHLQRSGITPQTFKTNKAGVVPDSGTKE